MSLVTNPFAVYVDRAEGWRAAAFVTVFALALITLKPFADLTAEDSLDIVSGRDVLTYLTFAGLAAICVALVWRSDAPALASLRELPFISLVLAVALLAALSPDGTTSIKRAALCISVAVVAAAAPLLPRGRAHLASLLSLVAAIVLGLSYFGVILLPEYAIHQATDFVEPELAGDWRGVFAHKNDASLVFGSLAFIGIYVARVGRLGQGVAIIALSLTFLIFTRGKTATALWTPALLMSFLVVRSGAGFLTAATSLTPLILLNALGVGSTVFAPLRDFVAKLPIDPTFTGRADVWVFAVRELEEHPILGYGFDTFWNDTAMRFDSENGWLFAASHAHNGILDAALSMGMIGVALTLWAFAFLRVLARDFFVRSRQSGLVLVSVLCFRPALYGEFRDVGLMKQQARGDAVVMLVSPSATPCGVEIFARLLCEAADPLGLATRTLSVRGDFRDAWLLWRGLAGARALVVNLPIVAWKLTLLTPLLALALARLRGASTILVLHEWEDLQPARRAVDSIYLLLARTILFSSPFVRAGFETDHLGRGRSTGLIPIPPNIAPTRARRETLASARLAQEPARGRVILGHFGSIYPKKQSEVLLDMAAALRMRGCDVFVVFIGGFIRGHGDIETRFCARVEALGLADAVLVTGYVETEAEIFTLFDACDAFAYAFAEGLTSRRGSVLACLQTGKPVVADAPICDDEFAHHRVYRDLIAAGALTFAAKDASPADYARAIEHALASPAPRMPELLRHGRTPLRLCGMRSKPSRALTIASPDRPDRTSARRAGLRDVVRR